MCDHVKPNGEPCQMPSLSGSAFCWVHDPAAAGPRARARQRGGQRTRTRYMVPPPEEPPSLRTVAAIQEQAERLFGDALLLPNGPARARVLTGALLLALRCVEAGSFEERLAAIESRLALRRA
jgi:hypothetical protein